MKTTWTETHVRDDLDEIQLHDIPINNRFYTVGVKVPGGSRPPEYDMLWLTLSGAGNGPCIHNEVQMVVEPDGIRFSRRNQWEREVSLLVVTDEQAASKYYGHHSYFKLGIPFWGSEVPIPSKGLDFFKVPLLNSEQFIAEQSAACKSKQESQS